MKENEFKTLLTAQLNDIIYFESTCGAMEKQLKAAAQKEALKKTIDAQIVNSEANLKTLKGACRKSNLDVIGSSCNCINALMEKVGVYLKDGPVNDMGVLCCLDRMNHYKIAIYKSAVRFCRELGYNQLFIALQNLTNQTYNISDRLMRLDDEQSDENAINKL